MAKIKTAIQILAIILVAAGIVVEIATGGHLGYVFITTGALIFAISTKIKERR